MSALEPSVALTTCETALRELMTFAYEAAYGDDPNGGATRIDEGPEGRWRCFKREEIAAQGDNLDIGWLRDGDEAAEDALEEPEDILDAMREHLARALAEIDGLAKEIGGTPGMAEAAE